MFASAGLTAETCLVTFTHNVQGFVESFTVGSKEELISLSVSGNYTVRVYDIINGFIIGPSIEYKFEVQSRFIFPPPPPSIPIISSTAITVSGIIVIVHFLPFTFSSQYIHLLWFPLLVVQPLQCQVKWCTSHLLLFFLSISYHYS